MSLLPLSLLVSLIAAYLYPVIIRGEHVSTIVAAAFSVSGIILYIVLYFFLATIKNQYVESRDNTILRAQMQYLERQTEQLRASDMAMRTLRHDMHHYIGLLQGLACAEQNNSMAGILRGMEDSLHKISNYHFLHLYTGNAMIDTVLSMYANRAHDNWIEFDVSLDLPDDKVLDMVKLTVVISNTVENAVNACLRIPAGQKRAVQVIGAMRTEQFFFSVTNTFSGKLEFDPGSGLPVTDKGDYDYGIQSIVAFARESNAILQFSAEGNRLTFSILI